MKLRLGVTRTKNQLQSLIEKATGTGVEVVPLPVIETQPIPFEWPEGLDEAGVGWLMFTSANGVHSFFNRMEQIGRSLSGRTRIGTVGRKTAEALNEHGHTADFLPSEPYGETFFTEWADAGTHTGETVMFARGEKINFDPRDIMTQLKAQYFPLVCYQTCPRPVESELIRPFSDNDYILFTAPSCVRSYQEQFDRPVARPVAIGRSTAAEMNHLGWNEVIIMEHADVDNILEYLKWN